MILLQMLRPKPMPLVLMLWVELNFPNSLNSFFWSASEIPIPVSYTDTMRKSVSLSKETSTEMPPFIVNLTAFCNRLRRTCLIR